ncbi:hypothetical protein DJ568_12700 [Mucilaginibacter hurinus]|uniref:CopG family transcriptional regulator n=1 Tax=Mucilaginibacter hurinus TaxID=2201324 RepID=A0A367GMG1_9SPHI|nr:hypothetical protein [Mucilaginibacter hurinus]RCH54672.1 hypothetical protein DJ568_12700 [Mucilaginibacter hurinus]
MEDYKNKLGSLADKLKKEPPKTPIQEVHPVKATTELKEPEAQLNVWIPKGLLKKMKGYGLEHDLSLKDLSILALEFFLAAKSKMSVENKS